MHNPSYPLGHIPPYLRCHFSRSSSTINLRGNSFFALSPKLLLLLLLLLETKEFGEPGPRLPGLVVGVDSSTLGLSDRSFWTSVRGCSCDWFWTLFRGMLLLRRETVTSNVCDGTTWTGRLFGTSWTARWSSLVALTSICCLCWPGRRSRVGTRRRLASDFLPRDLSLSTSAFAITTSSSYPPAPSTSPKR